MILVVTLFLSGCGNADNNTPELMDDARYVVAGVSVEGGCGITAGEFRPVAMDLSFDESGELRFLDTSTNMEIFDCTRQPDESYQCTDVRDFMFEGTTSTMTIAWAEEGRFEGESVLSVPVQDGTCTSTTQIVGTLARPEGFAPLEAEYVLDMDEPIVST